MRVFQAMLAGSLGRLDAAESGRGCLDMAKRAVAEGTPYHVILLDYMMPGMDGMETLNRLKGEIPGFDTPVVAVTADATSGTRETLMEAGFAMYLPKPVTRNDLLDAIVSLLPDEGASAARSNSSQNEGLPDGASAEMERELASCGISLSKAMKYADGNLSLPRDFRHFRGGQRSVPRQGGGDGEDERLRGPVA
jgi:CheY-like chemotaxis protein